MLYHYTTINTLGLILKQKKIKFSRLDLINDPLDGFSSKFLESKKIAYISCFTKRKDDSIPMWSLYTKGFRGVRIGFPDNLFGNVEQNRFGLKIRASKQNPLNQKTPFIAGPEDIIYKKNINEIDHELLQEIENPKVKHLGKAMKFNPFIIGKYKLDDWKFEEESRFIIHAIDYGFVSRIDSGAFDRRLNDIYSKIEENGKEIFINFNEEILSEVEILMGPKTNESDRIIIEALVSTNAPNIKIIEKSKKQIV